MARERINEGGRQDRKGRRWPVPNALGALALFGAIALAATSAGAIGLVASSAPICQDEQGNVVDCGPTPPTDGTGAGAGSGSTDGTGAGAGSGSTDGTGAGAGSGSTDGTGAGTGNTEEPQPKPKPKPHPKPQSMALTLTNVDGGVKVDWTACTADGFDLYKVVRSTDPVARWPLGRHDRFVGVVTDRGTTELIDRHAPAGKKVWYRVFCIDKTGHGYRVLDSTHAKSIRTARPAPPPASGAPIKLGFEAGLGDAGVALHWDVCKADGFHWYKVVRSHSDDPSYVPHTDGSELIGIIENPATTAFTDSHVESGQTWFYRVQCVAFKGGKKVLLGQTGVLKVTIP